MGLQAVRSLPSDAVHTPEQDTTLPDGTIVQQFRADRGGSDVVYEQFTKGERVRTYVLSPEPRS